jgi:hypothetical protein
MKPPADGKQHALKNARADSSLLEMFITAIKEQKLHAYSSDELTFNNYIDVRALWGILGEVADTVIVVDPTNGNEIQQVVRRHFEPDSATKIRVIEEWSFNPTTGKTDIQIVSLAPIRNVYGDNNEFRGVQALFWVRYADAQNILARYEQYHPGNSLAHRIWDDYFLSDVKPGKVK